MCRWVLNRVPRKDARALSFGKLLHQVFEDFLLGRGTMEEIIGRQEQHWMMMAQQAVHSDEQLVALDAITDLEAMREPLMQWKDQYSFDIPVLEVEKSFTLVSPFDPSVSLRGRPDRMGVLYGRLVHVQNRSLAANTNFDVYSRLAKRHLHELVYGYAKSLEYPQYPYGGTVFNLLRKLKYRGVPTKKCPEGKILHTVDEILWQGMVNYSAEEMLAGVVRATKWAQKMRQTEEWYKLSGEMPLPNEKMNGGWLGNTIDPYFLVMQNEVKLDDDVYFKNREEMYATLPDRISS